MDAGVVVDWSQACAWIAVLAAIIYAVVKFIRMPTEDQIAVIKNCLLNWVVQAETTLGSGTGQVKLSEVDGQFVKAFPVIKNAVPFEIFSAWVDEALNEMRRMLESNEKLRQVIGVEEGANV